jgi:hypothetical protein
MNTQQSAFGMAIDQLINDPRHEWLFEAGEQVRQWREEDRRNGIEWGDCAQERTVATQATPGAAIASPPFGECQLSQEHAREPVQPTSARVAIHDNSISRNGRRWRADFPPAVL